MLGPAWLPGPPAGDQREAHLRARAPPSGGARSSAGSWTWWLLQGGSSAGSWGPDCSWMAGEPQSAECPLPKDRASPGSSTWGRGSEGPTECPGHLPTQTPQDPGTLWPLLEARGSPGAMRTSPEGHRGPGCPAGAIQGQRVTGDLAVLQELSRARAVPFRATGRPPPPASPPRCQAPAGQQALVGRCSLGPGSCPTDPSTGVRGIPGASVRAATARPCLWRGVGRSGQDLGALLCVGFQELPRLSSPSIFRWLQGSERLHDCPVTQSQQAAEPSPGSRALNSDS